MRIRPSSTGSRPASIRSVVVLPQPDGPTRTRNSPSATSRSIPGTAGRSDPAYQRCARSNVMLVIGRQRICKYAELTNMSWRSPTDRPPRGRTKLHRADSRRHHRSMLLQQLFGHGPASRADLARSSGLTRVTVSELVGELLAEGLVEELGTPTKSGTESRVGKPPTMVGLVPDAKHILAIDLSVDDQIVGAVAQPRRRGDHPARASRWQGRRGDEAVEAVRAFAADLIKGATVAAARRRRGQPRRREPGGRRARRPQPGLARRAARGDARQPRSDSRSTSPTTPTSPCWASSPSAGAPKVA